MVLKKDEGKPWANIFYVAYKFVQEANLRISMSRFTKELLRKERRTVGRYHSRFEGVDYDAAGAQIRKRSAL